MLLKLTHTNNKPCLVNSEKIQFAQGFVDYHTDNVHTKIIIKHTFNSNISGVDNKGYDIDVLESFDDIINAIEDDNKFIRLRKYKGKTDYLVNLDQIDTIHQVWDKSTNQYCTKITLNGGRTYINVEEDLDIIYDRAYGILSYSMDDYSDNILNSY